jgi:Ni,Fe-hydrogenase III small subunit
LGWGGGVNRGREKENMRKCKKKYERTPKVKVVVGIAKLKCSVAILKLLTKTIKAQALFATLKVLAYA